MSRRVAVITTSYPRAPGDAAGHFVHSEVKRLLGDGHEVHVFAPGPPESPGPPALTTDEATLHWLEDRGAFGWPGAVARLKERPARGLGVAAFCARAHTALRRYAPYDRVQAHFLVPSAWPIALSVDRATELELIGHGSDVRLFCRLPRALRSRITRSWLSRRTCLRVTSEELANALRRANPELSPLVRVAASPIDVEGALARGDARTALDIPESQPLALIVSRLIPGKRVAIALHALALLEELTVTVVGDGPELATLTARFPRVRFTGHLPRTEALRWIAAADVLVSASAHEGAPSVVREARALGVPVVAVAAGDLAQWAERDEGLLLVRNLG